MDRPRYYRGKTPVRMQADTVDAVLALIKDRGLSNALARSLERDGATLRLDSRGALERPAAMAAGAAGHDEVVVDRATINAVKKMLFQNKVHLDSPLAASIVGARPGHCPPPDPFKCPHIA